MEVEKHGGKKQKGLVVCRAKVEIKLRCNYESREA